MIAGRGGLSRGQEPGRLLAVKAERLRITRHRGATNVGGRGVGERSLLEVSRRTAVTLPERHEPWISSEGWDSYRLVPRPGTLGSKAAEQLRLAHGGRVPLEAWAAALLSHIIFP